MTGLDRLRELANAVPGSAWANTSSNYCEKYGLSVDNTGGSFSDFLRQIADQIEAEQEERVTRRAEDREAAEWVREHGGLDAVKGRIDAALHYEAIAKVLLSRLGALNAADEPAAAREAMDRLEDRAMPEGMEWLVEAWPRFEDDGPVRFLDDFERCGEEDGVGIVTMYSDGSFALNFRAYSKGERVKRPSKALDADGVEIREGDTVYLLPGDWCDEFPCLGYHGGEELEVFSLHADHVVGGIGCRDTRRPKGTCYPQPSQLTHRAPVLAADGRPLREGEHVYHVETGAELVVKELPKPGEYQAVVVFAPPASHPTSFDPNLLTHRAPVLAADGKPIRVGDTVWDVESGIEYEVVGIHTDEDTPVRVMRTDGSHLAKAAKPNRLTHERPVLDAGGVPIREGDTVYNKVTGEPGTAIVVDNDGQQFATVKSHDRGNWCDPLCFTHTKPEPPDSWERIEEDAGCTATKYNERRGTTFTTKQQVARDLVRRCRALAERER